jgi:hypothetical protein
VKRAHSQFATTVDQAEKGASSRKKFPEKYQSELPSPPGAFPTNPPNENRDKGVEGSKDKGKLHANHSNFSLIIDVPKRTLMYTELPHTKVHLRPNAQRTRVFGNNT